MEPRRDEANRNLEDFTVTHRRYKGANPATTEYQGGRSTICGAPRGRRARTRSWMGETLRWFLVPGIIVLGLSAFMLLLLARA